MKLTIGAYISIIYKGLHFYFKTVCDHFINAIII